MTLEYPLRVQPAVNAYRHQRAHRGNQALQGRHNKKVEENQDIHPEKAVSTQFGRDQKSASRVDQREKLPRANGIACAPGVHHGQQGADHQESISGANQPTAFAEPKNRVGGYADDGQQANERDDG